MPFTLRELAECAERELARRCRVYPNRTVTKRMSKAEIVRELAMMAEIAKRLREEERLTERLI